VNPLERLVDFVAARYRWGLHPLKLLVALLIPVVIVWLADRYVRARTETLAVRDKERRRLPRVRRH
jgi:hypothetical protein